MEPIVVYVAGTPRPQPRPRFMGGRVVSTGNKLAKAYRTQVQWACLRAMVERSGFHDAVELHLELWFGTKDLQRVGKPHTSRPDGDNVLKLWQDCAEAAGLLQKGDAQVARAMVTKWWALSAGAQMTIREFDSQDIMER